MKVMNVSRRVLTALLLAAPVSLVLANGVPAPKAIDGQGYRLVKDWDFGKNIRDGGDLRREFHTRYIYENGKLDRLKPGGIESGMLRSKWTGQYGYFEARVKVPAGRGLWPAFWLNPEDQVWPPEIDIMEIVDNGRDTTRNSFHYVHGYGPRKTRNVESKLDKAGSYRPGVDYADGLHTFAVEWTEDRVRHFVDDVMVVDRAYVWQHNDGRDAGPAHVLMNLAVGGGWPGAPSASTVFPARLQVDYIRVWQK